MSEERIQKLLARAGHGSRRHAEELIAAGRVTVNGQVAGLGDKADPERDAVKLDGKRLDLQAVPHRYLLMHKPRGVLTALIDNEGNRTTVLDLIPPGLRKGLVPVGRLDFQTSGLLLLTSDGDFAHRLAHPRYGCTKLYEVKVQGRPNDAALDRLRQGRIKIDHKSIGTCRIEAMPTPPGDGGDNSWWRVELAQGRNRQIRDMFFRIGHSVQKLRRVAIGPISDAALPMGQVRELTEGEVRSLLLSTSKTVARGDVEFRLDAKAKAKEAAKVAGTKPRKPRFPRRKPAAEGGKRSSGRDKPDAKRPPSRSADAPSESRPSKSPSRSGPSRSGPSKSRSPSKAKQGGPGARGSKSGGPGKGRPGSGPSGKGRPGSGSPGKGRPSKGRPGTGRPGTGRSGSGRSGSGGGSGRGGRGR